MRGTDGLAVAQWGSAILSLFAIGIALLVFLLEQRRDNAARLREQSRDREARAAARCAQIKDRNDYVQVCGIVVADAIGILHRLYEKTPEGAMTYVTWSAAEGVPAAIQAHLKTAEAVRSSRLDNPHLVLTMSRAIEVLYRLSEYHGTFMADAARQRLTVAAELLDEMRSEIEAYYVSQEAVSPSS